MQQILFVLAAVCFAVDALRGVFCLGTPINWTAAGFCLLTIAVFLV